MDSFYLILVVVLFFLAISDLIVGVSNDAVNFLNSAIGSKAASFRVIMIIAAVGVLVGATFSSGMMEVARKGIFHPDRFYFSEIMIIFLAVMMTDVILLDFFNSIGLPTSTTVSIVFELLGGAVAISLIKIHNSNLDLSNMNELINTGSALMIIAGILLSVFIAFSVGAIIQYLARLIFSFDFSKSYKYFGAIYGGFAITAITYFILIKGARGASFMSEETISWIAQNKLNIMIYSFLSWAVVFEVLILFTKFNVLKLITLVGTFALAMAFAGNDLVNFIGVPLAGLESFKAFKASGAGMPDLFLMDALQAKVKTPTIFLLIAGLIMVITLWTSRKARSVTKTTIDLSRQEEGYERFESNAFARTIVRAARNVSEFTGKITPKAVKNFTSSRFEPLKNPQSKDEAVSFDLLRASINLVVASILIAIGTANKLPLSTTYVTFMVAMGTSLADQAWGRESAVYRISGVFTVIGGWFLTALFAFLVAFCIALLMHWGGYVALFLLIALAVFMAVRTQVMHREKEKKRNDAEASLSDQSADTTLKCTNEVSDSLQSVEVFYENIINYLEKESRRKLKEEYKKVRDFNTHIKHLKGSIKPTINKLEEGSIDTGHYYVQVLDYLRETGHCLTYLVQPCYDHVNNNHRGLVEDQIKELHELSEQLKVFISSIRDIIQENAFERIPEAAEIQQNLLNKIDKVSKNQVKRIKKEETGTKNSLLYINILHETKNLSLHVFNILKAHRDFIENNK